MVISEVESNACEGERAIKICVTAMGPGSPPQSCAKKSLIKCASSSATLKLECGTFEWELAPSGAGNWGGLYDSQACRGLSTTPL
ncbi:MAG: hypothetical protein DHS20C15_25900 [Planctomycetota bacterium]|nr:MAG: hypothetical protein DHS20C15_25900 [Planctomycetota bacterium]